MQIHVRQNTDLKAQKCSKFHSRGSLRDRMFELIIHIKAKAWIFPYKFCNYFIDHGFANRAKSWIQLRTNTVHYHFVFLSLGSCFKSAICIQLESTPIILFSPQLKKCKIIHQHESSHAFGGWWGAHFPNSSWQSRLSVNRISAPETMQTFLFEV